MLEQKLKQRLIGAAVLIGIGIILIPALLGESTEIALDSTNEVENNAYPETVEESLAERDVSSPKEEDTASVSAIVPEQNSLNQARFNESTQQSNSSSILPPKESVSSTRVSGWLVQIGSFVHQSNALQMREEAVSSGYKAFIEPVKKGKETTYKVRVGPEKGAVQARTLKEELERQFHINAFLIPPSER